jgi:hypothetical protein
MMNDELGMKDKTDKMSAPGRKISGCVNLVRCKINNLYTLHGHL